MKVEQKLRELGLELPPFSAPGNVYVLTKRIGNLVYVAGRTSETKGILGADLTMEDARQGAVSSILKTLTALKQELGDLDRVKQFVQMIAFVRCADGCGDYPNAVDGATELIQTLYGSAALPVRMAIGAKELPDGSVIEIMTIAEVLDREE